MIEKLSTDIKCKLCGAMATTMIGADYYCDSCAKSSEATESQSLVETFEE